MFNALRYVLAAVAALFLVSCGSVSQTRVKNTSRTFTTVVVGAGHGGKDNGALRRFGGGGVSGAAWSGAGVAGTVVASWPCVVNTATGGGCSPEPQACSVRWFASYAE